MRHLSKLSVVALTGLLCVTGRASAQAADSVEPPPPADLGAPDASDINTAPTTPPAPETASSYAATPIEDTTTRRPPNWPLLITGAAVLGASYAASAIVAGVSDRESNDRLFLPGVGPWLALHDMDCDLVGCKNETLYKGLLITDGAVQALGVVGIVLGAVLPTSKQKPWYLIGDNNVLVTPQVGSSRLGVTAAGQF